MAYFLLDASASAKNLRENTTLIAAGLGLVGTLFPVFLSWVQTRGVDSRRLKQVDDAMKRIEFWKQWLALSAELGASAAEQARQRVQHELDLLCSSLSSAAAEDHTERTTLRSRQAAFSSRLTTVSTFRRIFLLYKPSLLLAWIPRLLFYLFCSAALFVTLMETYDLLQTLHSKLPIDFFGFYFAAFLFGMALAFRALSVYLERPRKGATPDAVSS